MYPLLLIKFTALTSFDKRSTFSSKRRAQGINSNTHACTHTCTLPACSEISLYQQPRAIMAACKKQHCLYCLNATWNCIFLGEKTQTYILAFPSSQMPKSDAGLRNKRTPRSKRETGIFIHSMSDAKWILARTSFPRISQLLSEFKRRKHPSLCKKT